MADEIVVHGGGRVVGDGQAVVSIFYNGAGVDLPDLFPADLPRETIKRMATESVRNGGVPGVPAQTDLSTFEVDSLRPSETVPFQRFHLRPKATFGV